VRHEKAKCGGFECLLMPRSHLFLYESPNSEYLKGERNNFAAIPLRDGKGNKNAKL
jgi:hypothetical protein